VENDIFEIKPLRNNFTPSNLIDICVREQINLSFGQPHLIKRSLRYSTNSELYYLNNFKPERRYIRENTQQKLTIELAVFLDETAYNNFMPLLNNDKGKLHDMILAYVNEIQAVFHHTSLGVTIDILLVSLEIMEKQPSNLPLFDGKAEKVLKSFCKYAANRNPLDDNNLHHWDIGLYLTGIDLYQIMAKQKNYFTMGLGHLDGVCQKLRSCAIVEFGNIFSNVFSGFATALTTAHEIGHL